MTSAKFIQNLFIFCFLLGIIIINPAEKMSDRKHNFRRRFPSSEAAKSAAVDR